MASRRARALFVIALAAAPARGDSATPEPAPAIAYAFSGAGWRSLRMEILSPGGALAWSCPRPPPHAGKRCDVARWYRGAGTYLARARATAPDGREWTASVLFGVFGALPGITVAVDGVQRVQRDHRDAPRASYELDIHVTREHDAQPNIDLTGLAALPGGDERAPAGLRFVITNRSPFTLHGDTLQGNFFGRIARREGRRWVDVERGGRCGTVDTGAPLPPGATADTIEGYFIGEPAPLVPGHYRYSLSVRTAGPAERIAAAAGVDDRYPLAVEFDVPAPR